MKERMEIEKVATDQSAEAARLRADIDGCRAELARQNAALLAERAARERAEMWRGRACQNCAHVAVHNVQGYDFCTPCAQAFAGYTPEVTYPERPADATPHAFVNDREEIEDDRDGTTRAMTPDERRAWEGR